MEEFDDKEDALSFIKVLGKLHKQSSEWTAPAGFKRPEFKLNGDIITNMFAGLDTQNSGLYSADHIKTIKLAGRKAFDKMKTIEKNNMTWGLVHNDYAPANYTVHNHEICPIDFADCCFNYYLADLALAIYFVAPTKREFFFELYSKYFPLPDNHVSLTETLLIIRYLETMRFYLKREDKDGWLPKDIGLWGTGEFAYYLCDEPFLFDKPAFYQGQ
jgi:Ser/Thr protein kinase RdoA (MazF antagonist)